MNVKAKSDHNLTCLRYNVSLSTIRLEFAIHYSRIKKYIETKLGNHGGMFLEKIQIWAKAIKIFPTASQGNAE